ncbi:MAG: AI-2E family transporter [Enterocloster asparagiformis]|nr:AI-2E family transporter [Enterocloster asparagiformis]
MEKPGKKLKKLIVITGTTGVVYAGFKYLLPLVAPFFIAYLFALMLRPSARFLSYRLKLRIKGKTHHLPIGVVGGVEFLLLISLLGAGLYWGLVKLCQEGKLLAFQLPIWIEQFDRWLTGSCRELEQTFGLREGRVADVVSEMLTNLIRACKQSAMPALMTNSVTAIRWGVGLTVVFVVLFLAVVLSLQEMDDLRVRRDQSVFRREFAMIGKRVVHTGKAWFKTQGIILSLITMLCILGMAAIGNPYYIMAGIGIGVLDALPIFGTGTVLIPWGIICLFMGRWGRAIALFALYLICYLIREYLETRLMSNQVGLSPLETLAAVYVGLQLFGFPGFILGPLGLLLIEDLVEAWT